MNLSQTEEDDIRMESEGWSNGNSERATQEHLQQSGVESMDHHLVEFSETLKSKLQITHFRSSVRRIFNHGTGVYPLLPSPPEPKNIYILNIIFQLSWEINREEGTLNLPESSSSVSQ